MIKSLAIRHEVTVATLLRSPREHAAAPKLRSYCAKLLVAHASALMSSARTVARLPTRDPSSFGYFYSPQLADLIHRELRSSSYDLALVHSSSMAPYVAADSLPKILDFGDMDSQKWLAYADVKPFPVALGYRLEGHKVERAEKNLAARFDLCTCTTPAELETLRSFGAARWSDWLPNGVDADYFKPAIQPYDTNLICFLGRMDYYPNQECMIRFCNEVLPLVRARRPDLRLVIVGARPSRRVRALAEQPGVTVTGSVVDIRPYAQHAALTVAPLNIARGTQNKILESLAMGVPVVCSPLAARGIDAVAGEHLLLASNPTEYTEAVLRVIESPQERQRLASAGRQRMLSHHNWETSMQRLDRMVEACVAASNHHLTAGVAAS